jgi:hypothetical protein
LDEPTSSQEKRMVELNGATRLEVNVKETWLTRSNDRQSPTKEKDSPQE